ncbi:MAG: SusD/RagB family nutrient-binding outer membrane lipoprotein [Chitinophagaceae bacterium]|nr:SusD/RagB family nutrient-binding outer membrane lipoprotein [Chitinophagaceae bacterium]
MDPNNPTDVDVNLIFTGAQSNARAFDPPNRVGVIANMWAGYMTGIGRQYLGYQNYQYTSVETNGMTNAYQGIYVQLKLAIEKFKLVNNQLGIGISQVIQAEVIGTATALYGDIPFSQAGDYAQFPNPVFDSQAQVYAGVQDLLDDAITALQSGIGSLPNKTDIFFNGNAGKWIEVANTLKARFYLETKEYDKSYAAALKGISSLNNSMVSPSSNVAGMRNTYYVHQVEDRVGDVNAKGAFLTTLLDPSNANYRGNSKTDEEARFHYYFVDLGTGGITGDIEPNYLSAARGDRFNGIIGMEKGTPLVAYYENLLILAEAAARTKDFTVALDHLNDFRSFMNAGGYIDPTYVEAFPVKYEPYTEADFEQAGMKNPGGLDKQQALLKEVLEERYVSFFCQILGFNDIRRTQKDAVGVRLSPATGAKLPGRLLYDQAEISGNSNVPNPLPGLFDPTPVNK